MLGFIGVIVGAVLAGGFQLWFDSKRSKREYAEARRREKVTAYSEALGTISPFTSAIMLFTTVRATNPSASALKPFLEDVLRQHQAASGALYRARLVTSKASRDNMDVLIGECLSLNRDRASFTQGDRDELDDVTRRLLSFLQDELDSTIPAKP